MRRDLDELFGDAPARPTAPPRIPQREVGADRPRRRPGRPTKEEARAKLLSMDVETFSVPWLMRTFRMSRQKVESLLSTCSPIGFHTNGGPLYDMVEAAQYLVKPKASLRSFIKDMKPADLPPRLRESVWNAKLKEQKYRLNAGELWTSDSVMAVFGETFKTIKNTTQLWVDTIEEDAGVTDKQRETINQLVDGLLDELHRGLISQAKNNATPSQVAELDGDPELEEDYKE